MRNIYKNIFSYAYTFFILASLNVNPNGLFSLQEETVTKILNIIRFFFPTFILIMFFVLKKKLLYKNLDNESSALTKLSLLFFLILFFFSLLNNVYAIENLYFFIYFNIFANLYILTNYYKPEILVKNFLFILVIYTCYWLANFFGDLISLNKFSSVINFLINLRIAEFHQLNYSFFLSNASLNSNGTARIFVIIFLTLLCYQLFFKKVNLVYLFLFLLNFFIISLQSKFSFYGLILSVLILVYLNKKNKLNEILILLIIIIFPFLLVPIIKTFDINNTFVSYENRIIQPNNNYNVDIDKSKIETLSNISKSNISKSNISKSNISKSNISKSNISKKNYFFEKLNLQEKYSYHFNFVNKLLTGRLAIWVEHLIFKNQTNYFYGLGVQSDKKAFNISSSNALVYSYLATGILGVSIYLIICFVFFKNLIKYFIYNKYHDMRLVFQIVSFFLIIRTTIENGFLTYGLDLFLILICFEATNKKILNFYKP